MNAESNQSEYEVRRKKLDSLEKKDYPVYPDRFSGTHHTSEALKLPLDTDGVCVRGRIVARRSMGKISFIHILDDTGKMQMVIQENEVGKEAYSDFTELIDTGDFIGAEGKIFKTKKGEISLLVSSYTLLGKSLRPLPEKWHGLKDKEIRYRQRYLDLISSSETKDIFRFRSRLIRTLRQYYWKEGFTELETPILANTASGALAKPFMTHHNALDTDVYLRISCGELWQKMAIVGSFEKTFEIGKVFRNEGIDPSHLQEFTMVEHYSAYWNFEDNMRFTEKLFSHLLKELTGSLKISLKNTSGKKVSVDFTPPWPKISFRELIKKDSGIDIGEYPTEKKLTEDMKKKKLYTKEMKGLGIGNLIDALYKHVSRDKIEGPIFLTHHPIAISPLARKNDDNPSIVDRFQLVVQGWEIVNSYSELVDPVDQKKRFLEQLKAKKKGDEEAHGEDNEFVLALEHGAPPISGWGMGIDRVVALLTGQENLREVILFPLLRPDENHL